MPDRKDDNEYVLTTSTSELERLGFQHTVWTGVTAALWQRAGFACGHRLLDVACGPGYATRELARLVGDRGSVVATDISPRFTEHVASLAIPNVDVRLADAQEAELGDAEFDGAFARWVLCFAQHPERIVERIARALRPGGTVAIQDYFNYGAIALAPKEPAFEAMIAAVERSFRDRGGDPDVGGRVPGMLAACGLEILEIRPVLRTARPGTLFWQWPESFFRDYVPLLRDRGYVGEEAERAFWDAWERCRKDPGGYLMTPPVVEILARRP